MQSPARAIARALRSRARATATPRDAAPPDPPSTARARRVWTPRAPLEPVASAYVHLPFCRRRCYYCDFAVSVVGDAHETSDAVTRGMETYVETLSREIANTPSAPSSRGRRRHHPPLRTIFFGGGTPSLLPPALLRRVLDALRARFGIDADAEISMEMDPGTFDAAKLRSYAELGVNRVSLGVQSFDDAVLRAAGRAHTAADARVAIETVRREARLRAWSLDLISGLPGLSLETWEDSLREAVDAGVDHVSVYDLQVEEGTPFGRWYDRDGGGDRDAAAAATAARPPLPRESAVIDMFRAASSILRDAGYEHYEISSYARPNARCEHNQTYWNADRGWYGFGLSATSRTRRGARDARPRKTREYEAFVDAMISIDAAASNDDDDDDDDGRDECAREDDATAVADTLLERLMLGLRTSDGVDARALREDFGARVVDEVFAVLETYPPGLVTATTATIALTDPEGFLVSTEVISTLLARVPSLRDA
ncbi:uncharacterized protein MICPUCDRAFT_14012 [Micromonas pusilla CCMP1545]|uniref:Radical S-adenosyl methionine domain-containing protein 1, mitochondrial n=1 Tax=Micromonas pusilla (strain CCMP1545) TaxID=564608 RepID=C1MKC7_MICPC|nr:uncharacterized protein MICPUCDRAFT_14012 [Micromonas pusilla CCMP1545]EEH59348.1 predicted protein [Micromonas pusilla CCMP1545]|eukprot:XP_003055972.1 predicted protein [Micromonas pusilla CCMP1545]